MKTECLTAYTCKIRYLQRNNPMIEEQRALIKTGESPQFSFSNFVDSYIEYTKDIAIGESSDRAISMPGERVEFEENDDYKFWHIKPLSGKQGQPVTVIKKSTLRRYDYGDDAVALYNNHMFCYEKDGIIIVVFHRKNGSGCKSVFLETANNLLKEKGLHMDMDLIMPFTDAISSAEPLKIVLKYTENEESTDVADNLRQNKQNKKIVIRDAGINLTVSDNNPIKRIVKNMQLGRMSKDDAFTAIKVQLADNVDYNDAEILIRFGKRTKTIKWSETENIYGMYDITDKLEDRLITAATYYEALKSIVDEYYLSIIQSVEG